MGANKGTLGREKERIGSYKNPDKRCTYPFMPGHFDYCYSYASYADGYLSFKELEKACETCEYWIA